MKKLYIFDFDGTLMRTPEPEPSWWKDPAPFSWASDPISLSPPVVPKNPSPKHWISWVASDAKKALSDANSKVFLVTARVTRVKKRVLEILSSRGLNFDGAYFNPGVSAAGYKIKVFQELKKQMPNPEEVHIYEDNHIRVYKPALEKIFPNSKVFAHSVKDSQHPIPPEGIPEDMAKRLASRYLNIFSIPLSI